MSSIRPINSCRAYGQYAGDDHMDHEFRFGSTKPLARKCRSATSRPGSARRSEAPWQYRTGAAGSSFLELAHVDHCRQLDPRTRWGTLRDLDLFHTGPVPDQIGQIKAPILTALSDEVKNTADKSTSTRNDPCSHIDHSAFGTEQHSSMVVFDRSHDLARSSLR